jgi:hypothetical protein
VTVLSGGVPEMEVDDSRTTAGSVSMLETRLLCSKSEAVEVRMFSGGGIVSVCSQFNQNFMNWFFTKKLQKQYVSTEKLFITLLYKKTACNMLVK